MKVMLVNSLTHAVKKVTNAQINTHKEACTQALLCRGEREGNRSMGIFN